MDNDFLDPKIKPLVECLNTWKGIETFSSCEGHGNSIPFVCFTCNEGFEKSLEEISERLRQTSWRIVLGDLAFSKDGTIYTLRYISQVVSSGMVLPSLGELQDQIPGIVERLLGQDKPKKQEFIENMFPIIDCPYCGSETVDVVFCFNTSLSYDSSNYPVFKMNERQNKMTISCPECEEWIDEPEAMEELYLIIDARVRRQPYE
jgi:DNA-directed RNA polymerase subunit RPC12/RpoP